MLRVLKKNSYFCLLQHLFYTIFQKHQHIKLYIFNFYVILTFKNRKQILQIFYHKVNFRKKENTFQQFFALFFKKIDIISDVINPIAAVLKLIFYHFFCNITKYDCAKFHAKSIFLSGFRQRAALCPPRGMTRKKYPGSDRVKIQITIKLQKV